MSKPTVLFATRAIESPPYEGGFVLLSSLARAAAEEQTIKPFFFSATKNEDAIGHVPIFKATGWDKKRGREFLVGMARHAHKFDIVHTAHIPTAQNVRLITLATKRAKFSGTKFIQTITGLPKVDLPDAQLKKLLWGDTIVCQSQKTYQRVKKLHPRVTLIETWPSNKTIAYDADRRKKTRAKILGNKKTLVVFPGEFDRLGIDRSFKLCLEAFLKKSPDSLVVLACRFDKQGTGKYLDEAFAGQVQSLGETADIVALLEAADLVIYPSKKMDSKFQPPLVLNEALQLGTPVLISTAIELDDGPAGMIAAVDLEKGWEAFGQEMARMVQHSHPRTKTTNARFEAMHQKYLALYQSLGN